MPLKYQQHFKIIYTAKSGCLPSCFRAFEGSLILYLCLCQFVGRTTTTKSFFWRRIPIDVRVKATYCPNSFLNCLDLLFAIFFYLFWEFETSSLLIIGDCWLLIY